MNNKTTSQFQKTTPRASLELLYRISREIATTLDLASILERVLFLSLRTIGATSGSIIVLDENENPEESAIIVQDQVISHTNEQLRSTLESGLAGWVVRNRDSVIIPDTSTDERWLRRPEDDESGSGARSVVALPIMVRNHLVGVITLAHPKPDHLQKEHLSLVQAIADQAGIAILNAQLYSESQRQARVMTALANSATAMSSTLRLDIVLENILEEIQEALQVEAVALSLVSRDGNDLEYKAATHKSLDLHTSLIGRKLKFGEGFAGSVAEGCKGEIIANPAQDPRFAGISELYQDIEIKAIVAAPLFIPNQILGVVEAINPSSGFFEPDALKVITGIGSLAGSFIQNAQLYEELQTAHIRYHDLFENSGDPIIITDLAGNIVETNNRTLTTSQYTQEILHTLAIGDIHQVNWDTVGQDYSQLREGQSKNYESILITSQGTEIPVHVSVFQIQIAGQNRLQWILRDISERKKLDQLREDLTSMIFHDLRSPLSNVISSLDVIQASLPGAEDPEIQSLFDIAARSTVRIQRLTKSLLDINRLESGQSVTNLELLQPEELIHTAFQALDTQANAKNHTISLNLARKMPRIKADRDMLERVLINLFQNAIKYTPTGGEIELGLKKDGKEVLFWVVDSGSGVDPAYIDRIFDKYTRIHPDERIKGLGLGLAFCRLAVEGHQGRIWVENIPQGGAKFSFTIPAAS